MKKLSLTLMCIAALALTACGGGKSGGSSSDGSSSSVSGLEDGKKFLMMVMTDDRIGDFGGHIDFRFMPSNK